MSQKQTALQQAIERIKAQRHTNPKEMVEIGFNAAKNEAIDVITSLLPNEKEQARYAHLQGVLDGRRSTKDGSFTPDFEDYFKQTFKTN